MRSLAAAVLLAFGPGDDLVTYPAPPGLPTSPDLALRVNGRPVWVERLESKFEAKDVPSWFLGVPYTKLPQRVDLANFSGSGPFAVELASSQPIGPFVIRPKSRGLKGAADGKTLRFTLPKPDNLYIEIEGQPPLCLFANPPEPPPPKADDPKVVFFGPGVHRPGRMTLMDGQTIYLAGGAVVYGTVGGSPKGARIAGRGVLDGDYQRGLVALSDASGVEVEGVILRSGRVWQNTLTACRDVTYRNVKVLSFGNSGDGINPVGSRDVTLDGCFLRCTDDCIAIKALRREHVVENIRVLNCTMAGHAFADGVTVGFETNGPHVRDILVKNCDILAARGGSLVEGHSAFSIICDGPAEISNVRFEDIRVEEQVEHKLFEIQVTDGTKYQKDPPGSVRGVHLKGIRWEVDRPIVLKGFDEGHRVEDVTFEDCTVAGRKLKDASDPSFRINPFVREVKFR